LCVVRFVSRIFEGDSFSSANTKVSKFDKMKVIHSELFNVIQTLLEKKNKKKLARSQLKILTQFHSHLQVS